MPAQQWPGPLPVTQLGAARAPTGPVGGFRRSPIWASSP